MDVATLTVWIFWANFWYQIKLGFWPGSGLHFLVQAKFGPK